MITQDLKLNIELPLFPGFYGSVLEDSDTEGSAWNSFVDGAEIAYDPDDYEYDWAERRKDICEGFVDAIKRQTPSGLFKTIEFNHMTSPREYNFTTDKIWVDVTFEPTFISEVVQFMLREHDWLKERIREDWTSRSGFISHMANHIGEWPARLFANFNEDDLCRYVSQIWEYILIAQANHDDYKAREEAEQDALEGIYDCSYWLTKAEYKEKYPPKNNEL